jgi:hypothetical protein
VVRHPFRATPGTAHIIAIAYTADSRDHELEHLGDVASLRANQAAALERMSRSIRRSRFSR